MRRHLFSSKERINWELPQGPRFVGTNGWYSVVGGLGLPTPNQTAFTTFPWKTPFSKEGTEYFSHQDVSTKDPNLKETFLRKAKTRFESTHTYITHLIHLLQENQFNNNNNNNRRDLIRYGT